MQTKQKITDYWFTLFPELKDKNELDTLLNRVMHDNLDDLAERRKNEDFYNKDRIIKLIDYIFNLQKHNELLNFTRQNQEKISQYKFFEPLINFIYHEYLDSYQRVTQSLPFENIIFNCLEQIAQYAVKILVLDINDMKNAGQLKGNSSNERYLYYENIILGKEEYVKDLYCHYFELTRIMYDNLKNCCDYCLDIINKFEKDKYLIQKKLKIEANLECNIIRIHIGSGDKHEGKSVATVTLSNDIQILYKPHNLRMDQSFYNMIQWINENRSAALLDLYAADVISSDGYGWSFFVPYKEVASLKGIDFFYTRAGQLLCLLYMMNAVDCHYENLIAFGEYPVLIDTETLMHPKFAGHYSGIVKIKDSLRGKCEDYIDETVLRVGLLPNYIIGGDNNTERIDISGFSNLDNKFLPFKSMQLVNVNSDDIKVERQYGKIVSSKNCPVYMEKKYELQDYIQQFILGFSNMYDWILNHKKDITNYVADHFKEIDVRVLFRATHIYSRLLGTSMHPDFLGDDITRSILLSRIGINSSEEYYDILPMEYLNLKNNDLPYFTCKTNQRCVICKNQLLDNKLKEAPLDSLKNKIYLFSEWDKQQQIYYIKMAYGLKISDRSFDITTTKFDSLDSDNSLNKDVLVDIAKDIGDYLVLHSFILSNHNMKCMNWLTSTLESKCDKPSAIMPAGYDLYGGVSGVGEFLLKLGIITNERKYIAAAEKCANSIISSLMCNSVYDTYSIGLYNGISGYLLFLYDLFSENHEDMIYDYVNRLFKIIQDQISGSTAFDVIGGTAGCINVLTYIWNKGDEFKDRCKVLIEKCAAHLQDNINLLPDGSLNWKSPLDTNDYSGYAHGVAGIIAQLSNANRILKSHDIDSVIKGALLHERSFFVPDIQNWYITQRRDQIGNGWCHGAPGILLEKSILKENGFNDSLLENEFNTALKNTIQYSFGCTACFCHGDIGNLDIVYRAALANNDNNLACKCMGIFNAFVKNTLADRYKGRAFRNTEVVGMMLGTSGFGYSILRFTYPNIADSILCLT